MRIGITGCIGSGKSTILKNIHEKYGFLVLSCDDLVKKAYEDEKVISKLDETFHCVVNKKVDKELLKKSLNTDNLKKLNQIIHPYVKKQILMFDDTKQHVIVEVPLLFEAKFEDLFKYTIAINVSKQLRHKKLKQRDVKNYQNMILLEKGQLSNEEKTQKASFVIFSHYDELDNLKQIEEIFKKIGII